MVVSRQSRDHRGIQRWIWGVVAAGLLLSHGVGGVAQQLPQVVQPDSVAYTTAQQSALSGATAELERVLADRALGVHRALGEKGWGSLQFATFTAGSLENLGYKVAIVSAQWPDGEHACVLVGVDVGGVTAWVPVEATPAPGAIQEGLGRIPWDGTSHFDARYAQFEEIVQLGQNEAPVAGFRGPTAAAYTGTDVTFVAMTSHDPDGEIVLYLWAVDDTNGWTTTKTMSFDHTFETDVPHKVTLTVVDNRGARATAELTVQVYSLDSEGKKSSSWCGCGS